jgi:hypothetical protein
LFKYDISLTSRLKHNVVASVRAARVRSHLTEHLWTGKVLKGKVIVLLVNVEDIRWCLGAEGHLTYPLYKSPTSNRRLISGTSILRCAQSRS